MRSALFRLWEPNVTPPGRPDPAWPDPVVGAHLGVPGRRLAQGVRALLGIATPAILIALLVNTFLAQTTYVHGQSMEPNLHDNQRLVLEKVSYSGWLHLRSPQRGDIVVVQVESSAVPLIKRVIGLPGDQVAIRDGQILINGLPLDEPYLAGPTYGDYGPTDVPPLHLFVMGDNRNSSNDSRNFGPVPLNDVIGRAWFSYWPPEDWGPVR